MSAMRGVIPLFLALPLLGSSAGDTGAGSFERTATGIVASPSGGSARRVRIEVMSDRILHVTATADAAMPTQPSLMVTAKPDGGVPFTVERQGDAVKLGLRHASATVDLRTGVVVVRNAAGQAVLSETVRAAFEPVTVDGHQYVAVRQRFNPGSDESFYGLGQHQMAQMDYNGEDVQLLQHNMDIAVPYVVSSRNYGLLWDNNSITRFGNPTAYGLASRDLKLYDRDGKPGGLTASYFVNGKLRVRRVETDINYQFVRDLMKRPAGLQVAAKSSTSGQHLDVPGETVVWEGKLEPTVSGVHRFQLYASSYFRLSIDGKLLLDRWRQNWNPWYNNADVSLTAGKAVPIRVEWTPADGHIALLHNNPQPANELHSLSLASELGQAVDYYYVGGDNLDEVIAGYRQLTGKAVLLPRWAYGFWQSRQRYETQQQLLDVVAEFRKRHLPLDNIVQDWQYWRSDDWGSHRFDPARFPDPKGMIDAVHAAHANIMISVWPKFYASTDNYKELDARGFMYRRNVEQGVHDWVDGVGYLNSDYDPYSPEARELYWRRVSERLGVLGIDAWWMDATEPDIHSNVDIEENKLRIGPTAMGPGAAFYNSFSLMHSGAVYDGARRDFPDRRAMILTRSGFAGLQRHAAAIWSGDTASQWLDLANQIPAGVNAAMSGLPNWTFDIGGYTMENRYLKPTPADLAEWRELNLRWFQYGAFAPLFRSHGENIPREIYNIAPEGSEMYHSMEWYLRLRYRLLPYIYTVAADTWHRDGTILRALAMDFPADTRVRKLKDEHLLGPAFLVAPVHEYRARSRSVYLPASTRWVDFNTGRSYAGGQTLKASAPLARMPVFVRAGAIVPTGPAVEYSDEQPNGPITLQVYTGADGHFDLYDDDGRSYGYEHGEYARVPIHWDETRGELSIGARQGKFPGMSPTRVFRVRWIDGSGASPSDMDAPADREVQYSGSAIVLGRGVAHADRWPATHSVGLVDAATEARITKLMSGLSLEEKVGQMIQGDVSSIKPEDLRRYPLGSILAGGNSPPLGGELRATASAWVETARAFRAVSLEKRPGHTPIPVMFGVDAVHGNSKVVGATLFPHNVGLGAMHDPALMREIGGVTAEETAASGIDWAFGPTLAVPQDDRWGRSYEGYSEDPALVREYAPAMVRGLQGEPGSGQLLQKGHVATSPKHFLSDGGTHGGVDQGDADIDEATLIATHAQGYLAAIPAGALTIMASFSSWQGEKLHGNRSLLTDVLKGRLGFEGFVVGDWNGHGQVRGCTPGDCPAAALAGLDMYMAPDSWRELYTATVAEVRAGKIPMSRVDDAVRRILRVKYRLGLMDAARPWEGKPGVMGSPAHRAVARRAVRESLVLLKNHGGLLPLRGNARVLVVGAAADDIGRQSGGWTLSWQGTGNHNSDFPGAQSIGAGIAEALRAQGGSAELSADGSYHEKPDVAVVVYGEPPYAEMQGDLHTLEYQPGEHSDLAVLQKLRAAGIPVVSVFLSGRPLWVNRELNASDAFVAAWYPGSEGGGVADVLVGDASGKARHPFTGRLSYSWPRRSDQTPLNAGQANYDPLFALGFGLRYGDAGELASLPEETAAADARWNVDRYFVAGHTPAPWELQLSPESVVHSAKVDAGGKQEAGLQLAFDGTGAASAALVAAPVDLTRQANGDLNLQLDFRVDEAPTAAVSLAMRCEPACPGTALDLGELLRGAPIGATRSVKIRLGCFRESGADLAHISAPFVLTTAGRLRLTLLGAALGTDPAGAICPPKAP